MTSHSGLLIVKTLLLSYQKAQFSAFFTDKVLMVQLVQTRTASKSSLMKLHSMLKDTSIMILSRLEVLPHLI
jgi:hypothetical protein